MRIAVAGATGNIGALTVAALERAGHHVVRISRSLGVDLTTGDGLDAALTGVEAVVDATNCTATDRDEAVAYFGTTTRALLAAGERAGVRHHVLLSIAALDRVEGNAHYAGKREQERLVAEGPVPWTIVPATQFHDFAAMVTSWTERDGAATVAPLLVQPIAPRTWPTSSPRSPRAHRRGVTARSPVPSRRTWWTWPGAPTTRAAVRSSSYRRGQRCSARRWPVTYCCPVRAPASRRPPSTSGSHNSDSAPFHSAPRRCGHGSGPRPPGTSTDAAPADGDAVGAAGGADLGPGSMRPQQVQPPTFQPGATDNSFRWNCSGASSWEPGTVVLWATCFFEG
ncbi:SDR family oxidoreductase [Streptomyces sp. INA 01156]